MKKTILHTPFSILHIRSTLIVVITAVTLLSLLWVLITPLSVEAAGLRVAPLKYEARLELGDEKLGYVDVSNPNDTTITVSVSVEGFRQIDTDGNLEFYSSERLEEGITLNQTKFDLGPREAARVFFTIDSNDLPEGGIYGAVLFETENVSPEDPDHSSITTATRVGTLLLLENGDDGIKQGGVSEFDMPFWQFGEELEGEVTFRAFDAGDRALAFEPELHTTVPLADSQRIDSGIVFPGRERKFSVEHRGSYLGLFPVTATDTVTDDSQHQWVLAVTGFWRMLLPAILLILAILAIFGFRK